MKVVSLSTSYPLHPADSTAPFVRTITQGLAKRGFDVHMLLPHHPDLNWEDGDDPVRIHRFRYLPRGLRRLHIWGYAGALQADVALRPGVALVLPTALISCVSRLAALVRHHQPDVIHAHWVLPNGPPAAWVARRSGVPLVVSLHGSDAFMAERSWAFGKTASWAFRQARAVTACSGDLMERAHRLGANPARGNVIPYGVDPVQFAPASPEERGKARRDFELPGHGFLVAAVGRLVAKKGFRHLLDAVALLQDGDSETGRVPAAPIRLAVAGGGDLEASLKSHARTLGVDGRVRWLGPQNRAGVAGLLRAADALAVPSVHDAAGNVDGLPNVVLEGMASGLPVVASRIAGIPEVIGDGRNGILVPEKDPEALAVALGQLAQDPVLARRLGDGARQAVEERLNWDSVTGHYAAILRRVVEEKREGGAW